MAEVNKKQPEKTHTDEPTPMAYALASALTGVVDAVVDVIMGHDDCGDPAFSAEVALTTALDMVAYHHGDDLIAGVILRLMKKHREAVMTRMLKDIGVA